MNWFDLEYAQDRQREYLRRAEEHRRVQAARAAKKSSQPMLRKLRDVRLRQPQPPLKTAEENC